MNKEDLYTELGHIDNKYIEEADKNAKLKNKKWKQFSAIAAVFILAAVLVNNSEYAQAAIKKIFSFIPGIAITQEEKSSVLYSMDGNPQTQSNGKITFTVNNVYVTNSTIDIAWEMSIDFLDENTENKNMSADELNILLEKNNVYPYLKARDDRGPIGAYIETTIDIKAGDKIYPAQIKSSGGSFTNQTSISGIANVSDLIKEYGVDTPITITICGMSFDVKLKPIEHYNSIEEIGPTVFKNNISITAMPTWNDNELKIKMYSLNYSDFSQVYGYCDDYNEETRPYLFIGGNKIMSDPINGDGTEFSFNLAGYSFAEQDKEEAKLHIPIISMLNQEDVSFDIKVNDDGTVDHPDIVNFKYSDINIVSMKVGAEGWPNCIQMEYKINNNTKDITLGTFSISSVNGNGGGIGCWGTLPDENNISSIAFKYEDMPVKNYKKITLSSPIYLLTDEYVFALN